MVEPRCPLDGGRILEAGGGLSCETCGTTFPMIDAGGRRVPDLRCLDKPADVTLTFTIPVDRLPTGRVERFGIATAANFRCPTRAQLRKRYGTKLQKEILYYMDALRRQTGPDAAILDLGCGSGGNKRYLESLDFRNVVAADYLAPGAQYLVDAHRLPFASESFDMVLTTATLEHFYNPFIAFREMGRALKAGGMLVASGSFWESWHGDSCFHFTPGGLDLLCRFAGLELADMWSGWGFIPSVSSHALGLLRLKRVTYQVQRLFDFVLSMLLGRDFAKRHRFATSGSFGVCARKPGSLQETAP
jgi:SAM-dependent methyltransferase